MLVRPEIHSLPAYKPAERREQALRQSGTRVVARLDSNEGPWPPFPDAIQAMQRSMLGLNRYPDSSARALKDALAEQAGVPPGHIVVSNGTGGLVRLLGQVLLSPGDEVIVGWPTYPTYLTAAALMGAKVRRVPLADGASDLDASLENVTPHTK